MIKNPITSIIGLLVAACPIVGQIFPEVKSICDTLIQELIGLGFIAAADGVKKPEALPKITPSIMLILAMAVTVSACAQLKELQSLFPIFQGKVESTVAELGKGVYEVSVTKDGKVLYKKTVECTSDGEKLTGCHEK